MGLGTAKQEYDPSIVKSNAATTGSRSRCRLCLIFSIEFVTNRGSYSCVEGKMFDESVMIPRYQLNVVCLEVYGLGYKRVYLALHRTKELVVRLGVLHFIQHKLHCCDLIHRV